MSISELPTPDTDVTSMDLDLGIEQLDEMVDPGFWDTAAGVAAGTIVGAGVVYGGAVLIAT
jgi:hypothetical protein